MRVPTPSSRPRPVMLCFSHLRWNFVTQRPQHLLTRAARHYDVIYWEEPHFGGADTAPALHRNPHTDLTVVAPVLPWIDDESETDLAQLALLDGMLAELPSPPAIAWFYTPMAMGFAGDVDAEMTVYDCMDDLSAFAGASPRLELLERRLLRRSDLVFTGGRSLHRAKLSSCPAAHCFPSAVDVDHFVQARTAELADPADQAGIPHPRVGFFGVLDERLDAELVEATARLRPDWHFVLLGPLAKIDEADLPQGPNIHWLGRKAYAELPGYLAHWDAGLMPFARNAATRHISPTKTPEFLAAGVPLVSTPVADVAAGWPGLVCIADGAADTVAQLHAVMERPRGKWLAQVDRALSGLSWDATWAGMRALIEAHPMDAAAALAGD